MIVSASGFYSLSPHRSGISLYLYIRMKILYTKMWLATALIGLVSASVAQAQVAFGGSYTQNFSSMGTGTIAPTGWSVYSEAGTHATFAPGPRRWAWRRISRPVH
jgi:hypothetical protein